MTKQICNFIAVFAMVLGFVSTAQAQGTRLVMTNNTVAMTSTVATITLNSSTGVSAQGTAQQFNTLLYIDRELIGVKALVSGTTWTVQRGLASTRPQAHAVTTNLFLGPPSGNFSSSPLESEVSGSCTVSALVTLPLIYVKSGNIYDCQGSKWVRGVRAVTTPWHVLSPVPGNVDYTTINTNGTTLGTTTLYCTEVNLEASKLLTGIALLNGTTVGTHNHYVVLYDSGGRAVANSALAGALAAGASTYQEHAFVTPYYAVGPAQYFGCMQASGVTPTVRMAVTGLADNQLTKGQTGATFGTIPTLTVPTTFTTAVGPFIYLY